MSTPAMGRLEGAVVRLFTKAATVREITPIEESFRLVTLRGEALRGVAWSPGDKVQILLGGWVQRTYTPLSWSDDEVRFLAYAHGDSPASRWVKSLAVGGACTLFGPRRSLDLGALERPGLLFGDETSIGLAHALRFTPRGAAGVGVVLEVTSKAVAAHVIEAMEIGDVELVERTANDAHLAEVERVIVDRLASRSSASCALSGKAPSIQRINRRLREEGLTSRQIRTRAYWAPGKVGLD
ncbi:MAG: SIP domain-containing protein [Labilithrix sp.]|nr:SIP domain-containing protein [Labilithrix sp.]